MAVTSLTEPVHVLNPACGIMQLYIQFLFSFFISLTHIWVFSSVLVWGEVTGKQQDVYIFCTKNIPHENFHLYIHDIKGWVGGFFNIGQNFQNYL